MRTSFQVTTATPHPHIHAHASTHQYPQSPYTPYPYAYSVYCSSNIPSNSHLLLGSLGLNLHLFSGLSPAAYDGIGTSSSTKYPSTTHTGGGPLGGGGHPYSSEKLHHTYPSATRTHSAPMSSLASPGTHEFVQSGGLTMTVGGHGLHGMDRGYDTPHHHPPQVGGRRQISDVYNYLYNDTPSIY